jgi:hypothetical protein
MSEDHRITDEVLADVYRTKERLAAEMGFDITRILNDARGKQAASGHLIVSPPERKAVSESRQRAAS